MGFLDRFRKAFAENTAHPGDESATRDPYSPAVNKHRHLLAGHV
jgi:hypothetical protein